MRYFLSLGSNLGDREKNLNNAAALLRNERIQIINTSSVYETEPVGISSEMWFYNQVIEVETLLPPEALLIRLKHIEEQLGRIPSNTHDSRVIDIDILLAENRTVSTDDLQIPHPRMHKRNFVLVPLAEMAPKIIHPVFHKKIKNLKRESTDRARVKKVGIIQENQRL
jgi:2-amino-4-hydroxy-6-hydroxymethyldihydropteridine diphosphokinase